MNLRAALVLLISGLGITTQPSLADPITFTYTLIDVPGSTETTAIGINNASQIVGGYVDSAGNRHGFLDNNGVFTTLDFPGSTFTQATGINNVGQIVGFYSGGAFLYQNGTYTHLDVPISPGGFSGFLDITQLAINDVGQIVGTSSSTRAFLYSNGQVTFLPPYSPNSGTYSFAMGINNAGAIVGNVATQVATFPYVYTNGQYTLVSGSDSATAYSINNADDILVFDDAVINGTCLSNLTKPDKGGCLLPFLPHESQFAGVGRGLNDSDQIVGSYITQGFLATPVPEPASVLLFASGLAGVGLLLRRKKA